MNFVFHIVQLIFGSTLWMFLGNEALERQPLPLPNVHSAKG